MKYLISFLFITIICQSNWAQSSMVMAHNKTTIITNPSEGVNTFNTWAVFPSKEKQIRKITMQVTLAYPESIKIAHWDYMDRIKIKTKDSNNESRVFEIGRMLTPYGSNFKEGWSYTWKTDVTDFAPFLRDNVEVAYVHSGYESPDTGWDLTIGFKIDFGPPVAKFIAVQDMWNGNFEYGNPDNNIEKSLIPKEIKKADGSAFGRFRIQHTGHGMDRPSGCSEFCSRWRELTFDDAVVDHRDMWKECSDNPLYPQGGTWIFDRGYWCPGDLQLPDVIDMPLTKPTHTLDLNMEPFVANNISQPKEQITSYFFQYAEPSKTNDVAIEEIISPNNMDNFNRFNPSGFNPKIKIKNLGKHILRTLVITYKTVGFKEKTFRWKGQLPFYEETIITIPDEIQANKGLNTFEVVVSKPNGKIDEWQGDNMLVAEFNDIPTLPSKIVVDFLTNNKPEDNLLFLLNSKNDTVYLKTPKELKPATHYSDTINLAKGKYILKLTDSVGDGLEFWYKTKAGFGRLQLKDIHGNILKAFESDFGNELFYAFQTSDEFVFDPKTPIYSVNIFPRMVKDNLSIYTMGNTSANLKVKITKDGKFIEQHEYENIKDSTTGLNVEHLEEGRYVMEIHMNGEHLMNGRFNKIN